MSFTTMQIGSLVGCARSKQEDDKYTEQLESTLSKEDYEDLANVLKNENIQQGIEIDSLREQIEELEKESGELNSQVNDVEYLENQVDKVKKEQLEEYIKENNISNGSSGITITNEYWTFRRTKIGEDYELEVTINKPYQDDKLAELISYYKSNSTYFTLNVSLSTLSKTYLANSNNISKLPTDIFTTLNILNDDEEVAKDFFLPSFPNLRNLYFDANVLVNLGQAKVLQLLNYISSNNGSIILDTLDAKEVLFIKSIAEAIKDMSFKHFSCYAVNNEALDTFKYIPATTITPIIYGKYHYDAVPGMTYTLNDKTENLNLYLPTLSKSLNVKSSHQINVDVSVYKLYETEFNLPLGSSIHLNTESSELLTEKTLKSLSQYNTSYNDNNDNILVDTAQVSFVNTLSRIAKIKMLDNKEIRHFEITINIPKEGINSNDIAGLQSVLDFCDTYANSTWTDLIINAYNTNDISLDTLDALYKIPNSLRNVTFNNYGGNSSFIEVFNFQEGRRDIINFTFNNYSKVSDYQALSKAVSRNVTKKASLNNVDENALNITYDSGSNDAGIPDETKMAILLNYGYSEDEAQEIIKNKEYDKIFFFELYVNGKKSIVGFTQSYSLNRAK